MLQDFMRSQQLPQPIAKLRKRFLASIPIQEHSAWDRCRFASELGRSGFVVGHDRKRSMVFAPAETAKQ